MGRAGVGAQAEGLLAKELAWSVTTGVAASALEQPVPRARRAIAAKQPIGCN